MKNYIFTGIIIIFTILYISLAVTTDFTPIKLNMFKNENTNTISKGNKAQLYATYIFGYTLSILLVVYEFIYLSKEYRDYFVLRLIQFIIILILLILSIISNIYTDNTGMVKLSSILQPFTISLWIILSSILKKSIIPKITSLYNKPVINSDNSLFKDDDIIYNNPIKTVSYNKVVNK